VTDEPRTSTRKLIPAPEPDYAVPPGESLRERLAELHMSQAEFARRTGLTTKHVNQVMQGVASLSAEVAQRLEYATGTPSWWWLRLEADYRDALTRLSQREELAADVAWVDSMPVRELLRHGVLPDEPKDKVSRLQQLLAFFGVASVEAYEAVWGIPAAAFRQSAAYVVDPAAVAAWLRLGELAASDLDIAPFAEHKLRTLLPELRTLSREPVREALRGATGLCASTGVAIVFTPEVKGARAYGATRWLNGRLPVVQLSLRGRTDQTFWETVFHELGHVLLHGRRALFIESDDGSRSGESEVQEEEAAAFARDMLIPPENRDRLGALRTIEDAVIFAEEIGISAGLVAGYLQASGQWSHSQGNQLKRRIGDTDLPAWDEDITETSHSPRRARRLRYKLPGEPS
jgi:HTH-type transcriptional regulator / antitoxin HigA